MAGVAACSSSGDSLADGRSSFVADAAIDAISTTGIDAAVITTSPDAATTNNTPDAASIDALIANAPFCGDGNVDPGEQCDSGNVNGAPGCSATCLSAVVTSSADDGSAGTLRALLGSLPAGTIITFDPSLNGSTNTVASPLSPQAAVTIQGPGASLIAIDGGGTSTVFTNSVASTISGLSINNGYNANGGGALIANAPLVIDGCSFNHNRSDGFGGAIASYADTVTITNSTFANNSAEGIGGAVEIDTFTGSPLLTVTNSLFVSNSSDVGAGSAILMYAGSATITNSTFVANNGDQGAITNYSTNANGTIALAFDTITGTTGGPAVESEGQPISIQNSIVAGNPGGDFNSYGEINSGGYNGFGSSQPGVLTLQTTDVVNAAITLNALADNGGPTQSIKLATFGIEDNAIPAPLCTDGNGNAVTSDQRGLPRPVGSGCDIGAYELQPADFTAGVCGDGHVDAGEDCDDGNANEIDGCLNNCTAASCGDGFVEAGVEVCDGGPNDVGCSSDCQSFAPSVNGLFSGLGGAFGMAFDGTNLWVADGASNGQVFEVNEGTGAVAASVNVGVDPIATVFAGGSVWVGDRFNDTDNGPGNVYQIDPSTGTVVQRLEVSAFPYAMTTDGTHVWVAGDNGNSLCEIDASTGTLLGCPHVGSGGAYYALGFDGSNVWTVDAGGTVSKIDPTTNTVLGTVSVNDFVLGLVWDGHAMWASQYSAGTVSKIDPATMSVVATVTVGASPSLGTFDGTNVWFANQSSNSVTRINPSTNIATATVAVGNRPWAVLFDGAHLLVSNLGDATVSEISP